MSVGERRMLFQPLESVLLWRQQYSCWEYPWIFPDGPWGLQLTFDRLLAESTKRKQELPCTVGEATMSKRLVSLDSVVLCATLRCAVVWGNCPLTGCTLTKKSQGWQKPIKLSQCCFPPGRAPRRWCFGMQLLVPNICAGHQSWPHLWRSIWNYWQEQLSLHFR